MQKFGIPSLRRERIVHRLVDVLDEKKGINVNFDTHKEIHKQNIRTKDELNEKAGKIKQALGK